MARCDCGCIGSKKAKDAKKVVKGRGEQKRK